MRGGEKGIGNYSVYSIKDGLKNGSRRISELHSQASTRLTHKSCIFNRRVISQAGRRRFDPGLPLHKINNLQSPENPTNGFHSISLH